MSSTSVRAAIAAAAAVIVSVAAPALATEKPLPAVEQPLAPERNPPGDIPDNQVFIDYASPLGFTVKVPEGWSRRDLADGASFTDKYDGIVAQERPSDAPPDPATARQSLVPEIERSHHAVTVTRIDRAVLPAGPALRIAFGSNSEPNAVTGKAIRLENERYYLWKDGKLAILDLSAPAGADNADQWSLIAHSFRWR